MDNFKDLLTIQEAAKMLGVSMPTLRNWDTNGKLKALRHPMNRYRLYLKLDLEKLLKTVNGHKRK